MAPNENPGSATAMDAVPRNQRIRATAHDLDPRAAVVTDIVGNGGSLGSVAETDAASEAIVDIVTAEFGRTAVYLDSCVTIVDYFVEVDLPAPTLLHNNSELTPSDVLVKYTFYGDADLSGFVNGHDEAVFLSGEREGSSSHWGFGDFDYSGHVTGDDYSLFPPACDSTPSFNLARHFPSSHVLVVGVDHFEPTNPTARKVLAPRLSLI